MFFCRRFAKLLLFIAFVMVSVSGHCQIECSEKSNGNKLKLVYSEVNPMNSYSGYMAKLFKQRVEELSLGTIEVEIKAGGELGNDDEVLASIVNGDGPDFARVSVSYLQKYGANKTAMLSTPYVFSSHEHFFRFTESKLDRECLDEIYETGKIFKGVAFYEEGFRNFFSKKRITDLSHLEGLKFRASTGLYFDDLIKVFGASGVKIPFTEMGHAIYTGVVDGAEQPILNYLSSEVYTWAPYMILDEHVLALSEIVVNGKTWEKLTDVQKSVIERAGYFVQRSNKVTIKSHEERALNELKKKGVTITPISDKEAWIQKCTEHTARTTKAYFDFYNKIQELK